MKKILLQLDTDAQASTFDSVVAIDAGVDELLTRSDVDSGTAVGLIHGAMFTRGGDQLKNTAIFVGGSQVVDAERLMDVIGKTFFGPVRNSVMMDANGCNTTAAAAVVSAGKHLDLSSSNAIVLGGTGPVGLRAARMLASEGCRVLLSSRSEQRARAAAEDIASKLDGGRVEGVEVLRGDQVRALAEDAQIVIACGAAGVELMSAEDLSALPDLKVAVDLNAVPPAGLGGVSPMAKAEPLKGSGSNAVAYGPIGVGGLKMKTHRAAVQALFDSNDRWLDADEIYTLAKSIG